MAVDYNLVVIGGSDAGIWAAIAATSLGARVALVLNPRETSHVFNQALIQVGRRVNQVFAAPQFGLEPTSTGWRESVKFEPVKQWAQTVVSTLAEPTSPAQLASLGIDLIFGPGEFQSQPQAFRVDGRQLRAKAFLIVTGREPRPTIPGLEASGYLSSTNLQRQTANFEWPQDLIVIGDGISAVELSQTLARFGSRVTIITQGPRLLVHEDLEASQWIQAQLEAEGVQILTNRRILQVKGSNGKKWVQTNAGTLEAAEILLAAAQHPAVESLNLAAVGVQWSEKGIQVNDKLQTTNPRIYACGEVLGGYALPHVARYEAQIALKNALFWPIFRVDYRYIPWAVFTDPELARVGLTEIQARQVYGKIQILKQFYKTLPRAQLQGETTGWCKVILQDNGRILGAHLLGPGASEVIHLFALAMKQHLKIQALADLVHISPTFSEISFQTATAANQEQLYRNPTLQNFLEGFFNLRRS